MRIFRSVTKNSDLVSGVLQPAITAKLLRFSCATRDREILFLLMRKVRYLLRLERQIFPREKGNRITLYV